MMNCILNWDSWYYLYVENDELYLEDPVNNSKMKVKILHQAGGSLAGELNRKYGTFRNWLKSTLKGDVLNYINKVSK